MMGCDGCELVIAQMTEARWRQLQDFTRALMRLVVYHMVMNRLGGMGVSTNGMHVEGIPTLGVGYDGTG